MHVYAEVKNILAVVCCMLLRLERQKHLLKFYILSAQLAVTSPLGFGEERVVLDGSLTDIFLDKLQTPFKSAVASLHYLPLGRE